MFIAQIGILICTVLLAVPVIKAIAGIAALVFTIIGIVGLYTAGKEIEGCKTAFICMIVGFIISIIGGILSLIPVVGATISSIVQVVGNLINLLITYYVCKSVGAVMNQAGHSEIAANGEMVWKISAVCYAIGIILSLLAIIPGLSGVTTILTLGVTIATLVAEILYMIFLYKSSKALGA